MKKLLITIAILFGVGIFFAFHSAYTAANGEVSVYTSSTATTGYSTFQFNPSATALTIGNNQELLSGWAIGLGDSVNTEYGMAIWNHEAGTGSYSLVELLNDKSHFLAPYITSSGYTSTPDLAGINSTAANGFELNSESGALILASPAGVQLPSLTLTQVNALTGVTKGTIIQNSTTDSPYIYEGSWMNLLAQGSGGGSGLPAAPHAGMKWTSTTSGGQWEDTTAVGSGSSVTSGTWTPTVSNYSNCYNVGSATDCNYWQIGAWTHVSGYLTCNVSSAPLSGGTASIVNISLPTYTSNLSFTWGVVNVTLSPTTGNPPANASGTIGAQYNSGGKTYAQINFYPQTTAGLYYLTFSYDYYNK